MYPENELKDLLTYWSKTEIQYHYDTIENIHNINKYYKIDLSKASKIDTKIHLLKSEVTDGLTCNTLLLERIVKMTNKLYFEVDGITLYNMITEVLCDLITCNKCLSGVYFQEEFILLYLRHETKTQFKRRMIKQLNKAKRLNKNAYKNIKKILYKIQRLHEKHLKQDKPVRMVLNCNNWVSGICENKFKNTVHGTITSEKKRNIENNLVKNL